MSGELLFSDKLLREWETRMSGYLWANMGPKTQAELRLTGWMPVTEWLDRKRVGNPSTKLVIGSMGEPTDKPATLGTLIHALNACHPYVPVFVVVDLDKLRPCVPTLRASIEMLREKGEIMRLWDYQGTARSADEKVVLARSWILKHVLMKCTSGGDPEEIVLPKPQYGFLTGECCLGSLDVFKNKAIYDLSGKLLWAQVENQPLPLPSIGVQTVFRKAVEVSSGKYALSDEWWQIARLETTEKPGTRLTVVYHGTARDEEPTRVTGDIEVSNGMNLRNMNPEVLVLLGLNSPSFWFWSRLPASVSKTN